MLLWFVLCFLKLKLLLIALLGDSGVREEASEGISFGPDGLNISFN